jgi:hypothetical protein
MFITVSFLFLTASHGHILPPGSDVKRLIDTIDSIQKDVDDFRCEFEGSLRFKGQVAQSEKKNVGEDGTYDTFSGVFVWKKGGDTQSNSLHRLHRDDRIVRENLVVRMGERQAEYYTRLNDTPLGITKIDDPKDVNSWRPGCLGRIFLIDKIKREAADDQLELSAEDDETAGHPLKILNVALKNVPGSLLHRYWIDLRRNGHVVRFEGYAPGKIMNSRIDIKLASFKIDNAEVWMPVFGEGRGYGALVDKKPIVTKDPTSLETIYVVDGTMEFNRHPGRDVFTIKYKPGTPISDNLRQMTSEYGQQKIGLKPTKVDAEKMLNQQLAKAEEQKEELVVASTSGGFDWAGWAAWGMGALLLVSLIALGVQRRRH